MAEFESVWDACNVTVNCRHRSVVVDDVSFAVLYVKPYRVGEYPSCAKA